MERKFIESSRGKMYYWIQKNKFSSNTIFFIHGLTADHTLFEKQIEFFTKEYNVITIDMPLHGLSRPYVNFSFHNTSEDIKLILDREEINKTILIGQSAGGYAAQAFALFYPERTSAFISIGSTPFGSNYYKKSELFWTDNYSKIARLFPYNLYCRMSAKNTCITKDGQNSFYNCLVKLGKKDMLTATNLYYKDFKNYDEVNFSCPVLLFIGEKDSVGYIKRYNKIWSKNKKLPLIYIPNAGHGANYDNFNFFNVKTDEFLKLYV